MARCDLGFEQPGIEVGVQSDVDAKECRRQTAPPGDGAHRLEDAARFETAGQLSRRLDDSVSDAPGVRGVEGRFEERPQRHARCRERTDRLFERGLFGRQRIDEERAVRAVAVRGGRHEHQPIVPKARRTGGGRLQADVQADIDLAPFVEKRRLDEALQDGRAFGPWLTAGATQGADALRTREMRCLDDPSGVRVAANSRLCRLLLRGQPVGLRPPRGGLLR